VCQPIGEEVGGAKPSRAHVHQPMGEEVGGASGRGADQWERRWEEPEAGYIKLSLIKTIKAKYSSKCTGTQFT
jgi:hypothetical protein